MEIEVLKSKIHSVTVTDCDLNYIGSITIDESLLYAANMVPGEKVQVVNINNGERLETYIIKGKKGSGEKLFGSVSAVDLVKMFESQGHEIDKNSIAIPGKTIKRIGSYEAKIRLHREVSIQFPFEVVPEKK